MLPGFRLEISSTMKSLSHLLSFADVTQGGSDQSGWKLLAREAHNASGGNTYYKTVALMGSMLGIAAPSYARTHIFSVPPRPIQQSSLLHAYKRERSSCARPRIFSLANSI